MKKYDILSIDRELIHAAMDVLKNNIDDVTFRHTAASALLCKDGNIYKGINCHSIHGACAEFVAIGAAIANGRRDFDTIVAVHMNTANNLLPPCGNCRQMLLDYSPDIKVILNDEQGNIVKVSIKDLLPLAYTQAT